MYRLVATDSHSTAFSNSHFGGNILATRDRIGDEGTFDEAADYLNLGALRYPGGSLTERYFDITDPDRDIAPRYEEPGEQPLLPFSDFMTFAEETGRGALIVLPTRTFLSEQRDQNGDRFDAVDETALRGFIKDTLDGVYGAPKILGFELGNEYWDSGEMTSVEYGRVASTMARIVDDEIRAHPDHDALYQDTDILVQMGLNYGYASLAERYSGTAEEQLDQFAADHGLTLDSSYIYGNGKVAWPQLANLLVIREFDLPEEREAIDGIVAHTYSRGEFAVSSHTFALQTLTQTWAEEFPELRPVVTEWNVRNRARDESEDFGLVQATEMLDLLEAMTLYEAQAAFVYPVQQRSPSSLTGDRGDVEERVSGEFFLMLQDTLPGTRALVLEGAGRRESELVTDKGEIHAFAGEDRLVLYITSTVTEGSERMRIDLSDLISDNSGISVEKLGVAAGDAPGSATATPVIKTLNGDRLYNDGVLRVDLGPREIVEVVLTGVTFTPEVVAALDASTTPVTPIAMDTPPVVSESAIYLDTQPTGSPQSNQSEFDTPPSIPESAIYLDTPPTGSPESYQSVQVLPDGAVLVQDAEGQFFVHSSSAFKTFASGFVATDGEADTDTGATEENAAQWTALVETTRTSEVLEPEEAEEAEDDSSSSSFDLDSIWWALGLLPLLALTAAF